MSDGFDEQAMRAARPSIDEIARKKAQAELSQRLFGTASEPQRLGRFVILDSLGRGGMGMVYSAYDTALDRRVALKLLRPQPGGDAERMRARLHREAQALARLSHPNVVPVYDVGIIEGEVFIVMEFVVGQTLRAWTQGRSWHDVMAMYLQVAKGLAAAHAVGLVHRDVKPDNVMVGEDGRPRVLDFGLVRDFASGSDAHPAGNGVAVEPAAAGAASTAAELGELDTLQAGAGDAGAAAGSAAPRERAPVMSRVREQLTATNTIMGTPAYMAPEQLESAGIGQAADQFSFCVALYEALYGQLPFPRRDVTGRPVGLRAAPELGVADEAHRTFPDPFEPPAASSVPREVWAILRRGLVRDPAGRWPSMDALIEALTSKLAVFDQALADPVVQRVPQVIFGILAGVAALAVPLAVYLSRSNGGDPAFSLLSATKIQTGLCVVWAALLLYARGRWKRVKQLHGLLGAYTFCAAGAVAHDLISFQVGRTVYQTMLAILPMFIVIFVFAGFSYARWMAWIAALYAACLLLFLVLPSYFLAWMASASGLGWIVVWIAWRRLTRKHGVAAARSRSSQSTGASSSRG